MLKALFGRKKTVIPKPSVPDNVRVYAVGDIHGRLDLLQDLHRQIAIDAARDSASDSASDSGAAAVSRRVVLYLGDYIDRGEKSADVIDFLIDHPISGCEQYFLKGNHEEMLLTFLDDPSIGSMWMFNGGDATLLSYGGGAQGETLGAARMMAMQRSLCEKLPERHLAFLRALRLYHIEGGYVFVHAGVAPGRPIEEQDSQDLLWIRDEFMQSTDDHGYCVVHGHTICEQPDFRANRIGIDTDTGAYFSGVLTCLVLEGQEQRLLQT